MDEMDIDASLRRSATRIVVAYLGSYPIAADQLPIVVKSVLNTLGRLGHRLEASPPKVAVEDSINDEYLVCLEDGKQVTLLKPYLKRVLGMTPDEYRRKWNLRPDYPMVAPGYTRFRSDQARQDRLGHNPARA